MVIHLFESFELTYSTSIVNLRDEGKSSRKHLSKACPFCNKCIKIPLPLNSNPPVEAYNHIKDLVLKLKVVWDEKFIHDVDSGTETAKQSNQDVIFLEEKHFVPLASIAHTSKFSSIQGKSLPELDWNDYFTLYLACTQTLLSNIHPFTSIQLKSESQAISSDKITIGDWLLFQKDAVISNELSPERFQILLDSLFELNPIFRDIELRPSQLSYFQDFILKKFSNSNRKKMNGHDSSINLNQLKNDLITSIRQGEYQKFITLYRFHPYFSTVEAMKSHERALCSMIAEALEVSHHLKATKQLLQESKRKATMLVKSHFKMLCFIFHPHAQLSEEKSFDFDGDFQLDSSIHGKTVNCNSDAISENHRVAQPVSSAVVVHDMDSSAESSRQSNTVDNFIIPKKTKRNV